MSIKQFNLPDPGEGLTEAEIVTWKVKAGDTVKVNDIVVEIETAKSLVELPVPFAGTVTELLVTEGETVEVGTPTSTMSPAACSSSTTVPAHGEGSSTAALAVSTSHSGWLTVTVSPTATSHCRISPSVRPSPTSGSLNWRRFGALGEDTAQNSIARSTASSTRSRSGRYSSSSFDGG